MSKKSASQTHQTRSQDVSIAGRWQEVVTVLDSTGKVLNSIAQPLKLEFHSKDILQVIIGASMLAIPVGFTEETWRLGENLPMANVIWFPILSVLFIGLFTYFNFYKRRLRKHWFRFAKRVFFTYLFSFLVVAGLMHIINQTPWATDWILALKRVFIVAFPCSLSGALTDTIK